MTVPTDTSKSGPYAANDSVVDFTGTFPILGETQIRVVYTDVDGIERDLSLGAEYSVAPTGGAFPAPTFTVTTVSTYLTGEKITIVREMPFTQETAYGNSGPYLPEIHEASYDEGTMGSQQLLEQINRCVQVSVSDEDTGTEPADGRCCGWHCDFRKVFVELHKLGSGCGCHWVECCESCFGRKRYIDWKCSCTKKHHTSCLKRERDHDLNARPNNQLCHSCRWIPVVGCDRWCCGWFADLSSLFSVLLLMV